MITTGEASISTVTVGSSSTLLAAANPRRQRLVITNMSDEIVYVAEGTAAVSAKGIPLAPAGTYNHGVGQRYVTPEGGVLFQGAVYGICASGSKAVAVHEG